MARSVVVVLMLAAITGWALADQRTSGNLLPLHEHHHEPDPVRAPSFCEVCLHHSSLPKSLTTDMIRDWVAHATAPRLNVCQHCLLAWLQGYASIATSQHNPFSLDTSLADELRSHIILNVFWNHILNDVFCARFTAVWKHTAYLSQRLRKSSQSVQDVSGGSGKKLDALVWQTLITFSKPCPIFCFVEACSLLQGGRSFGQLIVAFGVLGTTAVEMHFEDEAYCRLPPMLAVGLVTRRNAGAMWVAYSCPSHGEDEGGCSRKRFAVVIV